MKRHLFKSHLDIGAERLFATDSIKNRFTNNIGNRIKRRLLVLFVIQTLFVGYTSAQSLTTSVTGNLEVAASGTVVNIGSTVVVGTGSTPRTAASVSIVTNFDPNKDVLNLVSSNPNLSVSFNTTTGVLTITGSGTEAEYQTALRLVTFETTSTSNSARTITFSLNAALPFSNGHYYEFITQAGITWTAADFSATLRTYFGLLGYLATITSDEENEFCTRKLSSEGWIGASDAASEGIWKWVTGPEAGEHFWTGDVNAGVSKTTTYGTVVTGKYANWGTTEPNNSPNEDYAHFKLAGTWNDYIVNNTSIGGYLVEYGEMAGDPTIHISDEVTVDVVVNPTGITGTTNVCPGTLIELTAEGTQGTVHWYTGSCGGGEIVASETALLSGATLTVWPTVTTTYYAKDEVDGVYSAGCASYVVLVTTPSFTPNLTLADIEVTKDADATLKYYTAASNGTELPASNTLTTGTYYISQTVNGVESATRLAVTATVDPTPCAPTGTATQMGSSVADLTATGSNIRWYTTPTGGNALSPSSELVDGTYYATQTIDCTESATRLEITVTKNT